MPEKEENKDDIVTQGSEGSLIPNDSLDEKTIELPSDQLERARETVAKKNDGTKGNSNRQKVPSEERISIDPLDDDQATLPPPPSELTDVPSGLLTDLNRENPSGDQATIDMPTLLHSEPAKPAGRSAPKGSRGSKNSAVGTTIGNYEVLSILGRGGMGVLYKARHTKLNRIVALKMILHGVHGGGTALERFVSEAKSVAAMQHPGIVQIFEIAEHESLPYFSLEFVDGKDLQSTLKGTPWNPKAAAKIVATVCDAMQYAHDRQVLHRDIKPANILLDSNGNPKVTDFGLAKKIDSEDHLTREGAIVGTPSFMAPEQARGAIAEISTRSDIYALGAVLYQLLTGRAPFVSDSAMDTLAQVINREPIQPRELQPGVPIDLETICVKTLQKDPAARYSSCAEMAADLRRFCNGEPILARPVSRLERGWRWCKRNPRIAMPSALAAMLVVSTAGVSTWAWQATSAQATIIAQERDNAQDERDEANKQKKIAEQQTVIAQDNEEKARKEKEEADRQRVLANEAKLQAEKNQLLAEKQANLALKNIQFIVTEIDDRLAKQPGMSEMRIGMLKVVEKKWDELDLALTGGILGQAIPTQMAIREKIADAWVSLDKLEEANTQLAKVYDQAKQRMIDKGRNDATRKNMSFISMKWAPIKQRLTGDPADRDRLMNEALDLLRDILAHPLPTDEDSPKPFEIAERLQRTLLGIASAQRKRGDLLSATASYVEAGEICTKMLNQLRTPDEVLAKLPPERLALLKNVFEQNLDMSRSGRANILCAIGKVDEAIPIYQAAIAVRRAAFASTPNERSATQQLLSHLINYGQYLVRAGRTDDGAAALAEANVLAEKAYEADSTSAGAKRLLGVTQYYLGVARDAQGLIPDSIVLFERSRVIRTEMKNVSADVANKVDLMLAEARLGNQDAAQALIDDLAKAEVKDPELRLDLARAISQLVKTSDAETAKKRIDQAIQMLERSVAEGLPDSYPIASEPDLKPLKDDPRLANIVAKLLANQTMK